MRECAPARGSGINPIRCPAIEYQLQTEIDVVTLGSPTVPVGGTFPSVSRPPVVRLRGRFYFKLPTTVPDDQTTLAGQCAGASGYLRLTPRPGLTGRPTGRRSGGSLDRRNRRASGTPKASAAATTVLSVGFKAAYSSFWRCLRSIPMASDAACCDHRRAARRRAKFAARFRLALSKDGCEAMPTRSRKRLQQKPHGWGNMRILVPTDVSTRTVEKAPRQGFLQLGGMT